MARITAISYLCVLTLTWSIVNGKQDLQAILRNALLNKWQGSSNDVNKQIYDNNVLQGFSWDDCSGKDPAVEIKTLDLGPNPLRIPGNITLAAAGDVNIDITAPIELDLEVKKKMLFWIKIPCIDNIGSCNYDDICPLLEKAFPTCPPEFLKNNIPCHCPVKKGSYSLPSSSIFVNPKESIPSWLEKGQYQAEARLKQNGNELFCMRIQMSIEPAN